MKKINFCDAYVEIWNEEKDHAAHHGSCKSCERDFDGDGREASIAKKQAMIDGMPDQASRAQRELQDLDAKLR